MDVVPGFLQSAVVDSDLKCDMGGEFGTLEMLRNPPFFFGGGEGDFLRECMVFSLQVF